MFKISISVLALAIITMANCVFGQITYTWNGSVSSDWTNGNNWTPVGPPTATDNVIIVTGANPCLIASNTTINNVTMNSGLLDLGTATLDINGNATFNLGTINGTAGTLNCLGATTVFGTTTSGPLVLPRVSVNSLTIRCQRTIFNGNVDFKKTIGSSSIDNWRGGNTFNGNFKLENATDDLTGNNGDIYLGSNNGDPVDTFNGRAEFLLTGTARIRIPQSGSAVFNGVAVFNSNGYGIDHDRIQPARMGSASCVFNDSAYFNINSATSDMHICYDVGTKCTFNGPAIFTRIFGGTASDFLIGNNGTIEFNNSVIFQNNSTGNIELTGNGSSTLASGYALSVGPLGFNSGGLYIDNFTQFGSTNQTLDFPATASLFIGITSTTCTFNGNNIIFGAGRLRSVSTTYNSNSITLTKKAGTTDDCGNNTFNGLITINNTGNSEFRFSSSVATDNFTTPIQINNSGNGIIHMSRLYNTNYPENIVVNNPSLTAGGGIHFGLTGGVSTLSAGKTITVGASGYNYGYLYLYNFNQLGGTPQVLDLTGTSTVLRLGNQSNITTGCNFSGNFTGIASGIDLTGNIFSGTSTFTHTGTYSVTARSWGGNTFTGAHTINISNQTGIQASQIVAAETYLSSININLSAAGSISLSRTFDTHFPEDVVLTSTSTGSVYFGINGGKSTLAATKKVSIGALGYTGNILAFYSFFQLGNESLSFTINGASSQIEIGHATLATYGSVFNGKLTVNAVNFLLANSTFNDDCTFTKSGAGSNNDINGNNIFNGALNFTNNCSTAAIFVRMSNSFGADTYNGNVSLTSSCSTGGFVMARSFDGYFNGSISCSATNNGYIYFGAGGALTGTAYLAATKTITCNTFNSGLLAFRMFHQIGNTPQNINVTGTAIIQYGITTTTPVTTSYSFVKIDGSLVSSSGGYTSVNATTIAHDATFTAKNYNNFVNSNFNTISGNTIINRTGTANDDYGGNITFNGKSTFNNSGGGRFYMGVNLYGGNTYIGDLTINNSGSASLDFSKGNTTNTLSGNLNLKSSGAGSILFGSSSTATSSTIAGVITAANGDYTNGIINLKYIVQNGGANAITGTLSAGAFTIDQSTLFGDLTIAKVGSTLLQNSLFNGKVTTTNLVAATTLKNSIFNGAVTTTNSGTSTLQTSTFNAPVTTTNSSTSTLETSTFNGAVTTTNSGTSTLQTSDFNNTVTATNSGATNFLSANFNGPVNALITNTLTLRTAIYNALCTVTANNIILGGTLAQGNTFNGVTSLTKTSTSNSDANGGNIFNSLTTIEATNLTGRWWIGSTSGDDFNAPVTFVQNVAGALLPAYSAASTFADDIIINSNAVMNFASSTNGEAIFDGAANQNIYSTGTGSNHIFRYITTNKPSGFVKLNTPIINSSLLKLLSGNIQTDATNLLTMIAGSSVIAVSDAAYISGPIRKVGNTAFTFPIGKGGFYRPAGISAPSNATHHFTGEYFNADPHNAGYLDTQLDPTIQHVSDCEYWIIDRTFGTSNVVVTLSFKPYTGGGCSGVTNPSTLKVARWNGAQWKDHGNGGTTGSTNGTIITAGAVTAFSPFTLATNDLINNPLPIELINFNAKLNGDVVDLTWQTESEINNDYFDVERSADGSNFESVTTLKGAGNSTSLLSYATIDENPYLGLSYYRLKQVDSDGAFTYSQVVAISNTVSKIAVYPNPVLDATQGFTIDLSSLKEPSESLTITDELGRIIFTTNKVVNEKLIIQTAQYESGLYFITTKTAHQQFVTKIVIK